jgi:hypothetical protein
MTADVLAFTVAFGLLATFVCSAFRPLDEGRLIEHDDDLSPRGNYWPLHG